MASVRIECGISDERLNDFDGGVPADVIDCGATDYNIKGGNEYGPPTIVIQGKNLNNESPHRTLITYQCGAKGCVNIH